MSFLASILPTEGYICVALLLPNGAFRPFFENSVGDAQARINALNNDGHTVFVAQASFRTTENRKQVNALYLRNFFLDIDCGEGKPYASQAAGCAALKSFCDKTSMPMPSVVSSGNGLYAHWRLTTHISATLWQSAGMLLKKIILATEAGLDNDGLCADSARVLRPVGATHRKDPLNLKTVRLIHEAPALSAVEMMNHLKSAADALHVTPPAPKSVPINAEFASGIEGPPSSAVIVASKCAQIDNFRSHPDTITEPVWYAAIGLLRYCTEGEEIIHEWSQGHSGYTAEETDRKIEQHKAANIGPTTCHFFSQLHPSLCTGCRHANKITTPLQVGRPEPKAITTDDTSYTEPPNGFTVSQEGVFARVEGESTRIYSYPLWVSSINRDYYGESVTLRHYLPYEGWKDVVVQSSKINEPKAFFTAIHDEHIHVIGKESKGAFMRYIETFMAKLRDQREISQLSGQMGWSGEAPDMSFALGSELIKADGAVQAVGYSTFAPDFVKSMKKKGELLPWAQATSLLNKEGMEGLAFEFLATAFAAPLIKFTGHSGALISVVGDSGLGKTLVGRWGLSAYGDPDKLILMRDDTRNAMVGRLGVYGSLPAYVDEVSNIEPKDLSELAYRFTQGREKIRLTKNSKERDNINTWTTVGVVSSNHPMFDKLAYFKGDASAELNRIFEYELQGEGINRAEGAHINNVITENYGGIGREYVKYLAANQSKHRENLEKISKVIDAKAESKGDERYWSMIAAAVIYGGMIAQNLGLSQVDPARLMPWAVEQIRGMRGYKIDQCDDAVAYLGQFIDRYNGQILVVDSFTPGDKFKATYKDPKPFVAARIETGRKRMWISLDILRNDMHKKSVSLRKLSISLRAKGVLIGTPRICLGRGTLFSGVSQPTWEIDLTVPELGYVAIQALSVAEEKKEARNV